MTPSTKDPGSEYAPVLTDSEGRQSFAPLHFFDQDEAQRYAEFSEKLNVFDDARTAVWANTAQWK